MFLEERMVKKRTPRIRSAIPEGYDASESRGTTKGGNVQGETLPPFLCRKVACL